MIRTCLKLLIFFSLFFFIFLTPLFNKSYVYAQACGNGNCTGGENCSNCPADCACTGGTVCNGAGVCIAPPPTNTPTPTTAPPTNGPTPTSKPGTTPQSGGGTTGGGQPSVTYNPFITISHQPATFTNSRSLFFAGIASVEKVGIISVEYTVTDGAEWLSAKSTHGKFDQPNEGFSFTTPSMPDGAHSIKIRARSSQGQTVEKSITVTIVTTPPTVMLDTIKPNPTKNTQPTLKGTSSAKYGSVARVEVSLDNGASWQPAKNAANFSYIPSQPLDDGNYLVLARAFDNAGNVGTSALQTLVIDTIPPIIGGSLQTVGSQLLLPDSGNSTTVVAGALIKIAISMKGGATSALISSPEKSFELKQQTDNHLWIGDLSFDTPGEKLLKISATDGAGNNAQRSYGSIIVLPSGVVKTEEGQPIANATVSLYYFDNVSGQFILWDGKSHGQENPQKTNEKGQYRFMAPPGKYYLEVKALGFYTKQSSIIQDTKIIPIAQEITMRSEPKLVLPWIFGDLVLALPSFAPPDMFEIKNPQVNVTKENLTGTKAQQFLLPAVDGQIIPLVPTGKKVILSFISPWSPPSLAQAEILSDLVPNLPKDSAIVVVNLQESQGATDSFIKRGNYKFTAVYDTDGKSAGVFNVTTLPFNIFVDSKGMIQNITSSILTKNEILNILNILQ